MKFTNEDYQELKTRVNKITQDSLNLHIEDVKKEGKFKNLETRITWDIYWACGIDKHYLIPKYTLLNHPYNDSHIETATKRAIKEVGLIIKI